MSDQLSTEPRAVKATIDDPTLLKLIEWSRGYLSRKRQEEPTRETEFALDLWVGMLSALEELRELRQRLIDIQLQAQADCL